MLHYFFCQSKLKEYFSVTKCGEKGGVIQLPLKVIEIQNWHYHNNIKLYDNDNDDNDNDDNDNVLCIYNINDYNNKVIIIVKV